MSPAPVAHIRLPLHAFYKYPATAEGCGLYLFCREAMLARKRREYRDYLPQFYDVSPADRTEDETNALRQVR